jgi:tetratricopeptide (TPR) repeat protein
MFALTRPISVFFLISLLSFAAVAQVTSGSPVTPEMRAAANEFYQKQDWKNAAQAYEKIVQLEEKNPNARYRYGVSLLGLNKNAEAQKQLEKAFEIAPNSIFALSLARVYVRLSDKERAYQVLEKSLTLGGIQPQALSDEKDFTALKEEARFNDLLKKSDIAVNPCKASDEFRQFDFWVGEWDARNLQGVVVGSSSVQNILGQCVIFENWSSPVSSGKSFNIYNVNDKKWHQTWVSDRGNFTHYIGEFKEGKMIYVAETMQGGKKTLAKMTFSKLPNGDVRQFGETSLDEGKTWTPAFDFTYTRKKQ